MLKRTIDDLGFTDVVAQIRRFCMSSEGERSIASDSMITDESAYLSKQGRIDSIMALLSENSVTGVESFPDIAQSLSDLQDKPFFSLDAASIYDIGLYIQSALKMAAFLSLPSQDPRLLLHPVSDLIGSVSPSLSDLEAHIFNVLEPPGQVRKTHPAIARAIAEIEHCRSDRASYSSSLVSSNRSMMQADKPSFKDSRVVVPLKAELKSEMLGLVHSYSASSQTLYVEPFKLVEYNNSVVMAEQNLQIEIARLVHELSDEVRSCELELRDLSRRICVADSLFAYASWARNCGCCKVMISSDSSISLLGCRHPLLRTHAVPITVSMAPEVRAMVISGPNAGGKTVTIKTVGLMALLNQICGFIPASDGSCLPLYDQVFTDIGDDQSIEADLSTFSGHMNQVGFILRTMTTSSLVILDELGSGTDETEGAAIARAVLQYCMAHCRTVLVSSHHNALKQFAYVNPNVMNASMEFDESSHKPTFRVISGLPGESHALDTAIRMHLPPEVIDNARSFLGHDEVSISALIRGLEQKRIEADSKLALIAEQQKTLTESLRRSDLRALQLDQKEYIIRKGKLSELDSFISSTRSQLENLVTELRTGELTREKTVKVKQFISSMEESQQAYEEKLRSASDSIAKRTAAATASNPSFAVGSDVLCGTYKRQGVITRTAGKGRWQVAIGPMKFTFKESELTLAPTTAKSKVHVEYSVSSIQPRLVLDVRGMTLEEATQALSDQIEACLVHGLPSFSIIHGYGDGILSRGLHQYLSHAAGVSSFKFAMPEDGGQGKTYVSLG